MLLIAIGLIYWDIFISLVGIGFFMYGRKRPDGAAMVTGLVLMVYPYFIGSLEWSIGIGIVICAVFTFLKKMGSI